ncbi:MAG: hypothetical protein ACPH5V_09560 [Alcanivorax sp.]
MKRVVWIGTACLLSLPALAEIPNSYRAERWEGSFRVIGLEGQSFTGDGGSKAKVDDDIGFGFDMAYNLDEKLSLGFALEWVDTDFRTTTQPVAGAAPLMAVATWK